MVVSVSPGTFFVLEAVIAVGLGIHYGFGVGAAAAAAVYLLMPYPAVRK